MKRDRHQTPVRFAHFGPVFGTRYPELSYQMQGAGNWRLITNDTGSAIGPQYGTQAELLADLDRFARDYGCH